MNIQQASQAAAQRRIHALNTRGTLQAAHQQDKARGTLGRLAGFYVPCPRQSCGGSLDAMTGRCPRCGATRPGFAA